MSKVVKNALLAGFWAALGAFSAAQSFSKTAVFAALVVGLRAAVGHFAIRMGRRLAVDN